MMEILQVLKFSRKQALRDRLAQTSMVSNEASLAQDITVSPDEAARLLRPDNIETFVHLLDEFTADLP
ncbi:hypothetical protein NUW54_g14252 [Trametes sanguinea]|uniref:Uncharacterized protein n=1 Tax=Trametes sanguinea TaxID=158606 RepID=A0ACC1ME58_9APHY|nr:hypothetical protein NUW54_g14252 [Trametes sanguinea]